MKKEIEKLVFSETEKFYKKLFEEEGITKEDLEMVDLDIKFSPVIPFAGGNPSEVIETMGGSYIIIGFLANPIPPETLKIMRYRYLISKFSGYH